MRSFLYEGYGPGGVAVLVEVLTDNKNRTGKKRQLQHATAFYLMVFYIILI